MIRQYVADMEAPTPALRGKRPLRKASNVVTEAPGNPSWYQSVIKLRPHFKYMDSDIELSLVEKLDKE